MGTGGTGTRALADAALLQMPSDAVQLHRPSGGYLRRSAPLEPSSTKHVIKQVKGSSLANGAVTALPLDEKDSIGGVPCSACIMRVVHIDGSIAVAGVGESNVQFGTVPPCGLVDFSPPFRCSFLYESSSRSSRLLLLVYLVISLDPQIQTGLGNCPEVRVARPVRDVVVQVLEGHLHRFEGLGRQGLFAGQVHVQMSKGGEVLQVTPARNLQDLNHVRYHDSFIRGRIQLVSNVLIELEEKVW